MAHATRPRALRRALLLVLPLAGCTGLPAAEGLRAMLPGFGEAPAPVVVTGPALVLSAPRQAVLVPAGPVGSRRIWRGEGVAVEMEGARVVATAGLARQVMATRIEGPDPLDDPRALLARPAVTRRLVDVSDASRDPAGMRFGLALDCTLRARQEAAAILVEERCTADGADITNRFWARPESGQVERSEQWAGDGLPALALRLQER